MELDLQRALGFGLRGELERDADVVLLGEDIGALGGVFGVTRGLLEEFGVDRVIDLPPSEGGIVGAAAGMALYGLRPVAEVQFADFVYPAFDQLVSEVAKMRYRSGGQYTCPLTLRLPCGGGIGGGPYHSQSPEAYFAHTPGLVVVAPSSPRQAVGLLRSAVRCDDPVVFLEPKRLYRGPAEDVPGEDFTVTLGRARRAREGRDVSVFAWGGMVGTALRAAAEVVGAGIEAEVIDLRTLVPLDVETAVESVARTGRAVVVQEAPRSCGYAAELAALLAEKAVLYLEAPVRRVTAPDTPCPRRLEEVHLPDEHRIAATIEEVVEF